MNESLDARLRARLARLDREGLRRTLRPPEGLDLSSNDYLGLSRHPRVREAMRAAIDQDGVGSTGSRLLRGEREAFARVERRFAAFQAASTPEKLELMRRWARAEALPLLAASAAEAR